MATSKWLSKCQEPADIEGRFTYQTWFNPGLLRTGHFLGRWGGVAFWYYGIKTALSTCHFLETSRCIKLKTFLTLSFIKYRNGSYSSSFFSITWQNSGILGVVMLEMRVFGWPMIEDIQKICWDRVYSNSFSFTMRSKWVRFYPLITDLQYTASYLCYFSSLQVAFTKKLK